MPAHNAQMPYGDPPDYIVGRINVRASESILAEEIRELRSEIAALRKELRPVPSLIVTGQRALDAFEKLTSKGRRP